MVVMIFVILEVVQVSSHTMFGAVQYGMYLSFGGVEWVFEIYCDALYVQL